MRLHDLKVFIRIQVLQLRRILHEGDGALQHRFVFSVWKTPVKKPEMIPEKMMEN